MIRDARPMMVNAIFDVNGTNIFKIPVYQREYSWSEENWEYLINDIEDEAPDSSHFLGTILCIQNGLQFEYDVIDGQQRMTTLSLLYLAILDRLNQMIQHPEPTINIDDLNRDKTFLISRITAGNRGLKLTLSDQKNNNTDYRYQVHRVIPQTLGIPEPSHFGNRRIAKAFRYFQKRFLKYNYSELSNTLEKVGKTILVFISVDSAESAFMLFESLNNRGEALTPIDIIKSKIFNACCENH